MQMLFQSWILIVAHTNYSNLLREVALHVQVIWGNRDKFRQQCLCKVNINVEVKWLGELACFFCKYL